MEWPKVIDMSSPAGKITIEAHAPWCPNEQARQWLARGNDAIVFQGFTVECHCRSQPEREKYEALTAMVPV